MQFLITRATSGPVSKDPPCEGAVRGPESTAWPGEYQWTVELATLEDLITFLDKTGGALGLFSPEVDEVAPVIEIFDDDEEEVT